MCQPQDADNLSSTVQYLAPIGATLNVEERAALQHSLITLRQQNHFQRVMFWGKVQGIEGYYIIAQGIGAVREGKIESYFEPKRSFYV